MTSEFDSFLECRPNNGDGSSSQSLKMTTMEKKSTNATTSLVNKKSARGGTSTGRYSRIPIANQPSLRLEDYLEVVPTSNPQDRQQQDSTYGKKTPESRVRSSNMAGLQPAVMKKRTGMLSGNPPRPDKSMLFLKEYSFLIMGLSDESRQTFVLWLEWKENVLSSLVQLVQESHTERGKKPVWTVTLKIRGQSSGTVTAVKHQLLWMNFEEVLMSRTSYAGSTSIHAEWRLKDHQSL